MNPAIAREYRRLREKGFAPEQALDAAKVNIAFESLEAAGVVRLRIEQESWSYGDMGLEEPKPDAHIERIKAFERRVYDIEWQGVWVVGSEYRNERGEWRLTDSCGGFVGEDWRDSGYDTDLKVAAMGAYLEAHANDYDNVATYAAGGAL